MTGILRADPSMAAGMARIARAWEAFGFAAEEVRPATPGDLERSGSSWAKRLRAGRERPVWVVRLRRRSRP